MANPPAFASYMIPSPQDVWPVAPVQPFVPLVPFCPRDGGGPFMVPPEVAKRLAAIEERLGAIEKRLVERRRRRKGAK